MTIGRNAIIVVFLAAGFSMTGEAQTSKDPSIHQPVSPGEIERLRRAITRDSRSSVEVITEYHNESGDLNNRLDWGRFGARVNLKWRPSTLFYFSATRTRYMTREDFFDGDGTNLTAGVKGALSESVDAQFEIGATRFSTDTSTVNALGSINFRVSDRTNAYITGSRTNVEETLLSATGLRPTTGPFAGMLVGRVMDNRFTAGALYRLPYQIDVFGEGGFGSREGSNVDSNFFRHARAGAGMNLISGSQNDALKVVRASYLLNYFGFNEDRLGFGGASLLNRRGQILSPELLGSDGISPFPELRHPGVGGYFSPEYFVSNVGRLEVQGLIDPAIEYRIAGFAGAQSYTGSRTRQVSGFSAALEFILTDHFSIPVTYFRDNFGPFTQQSIQGSLKISF